MKISHIAVLAILLLFLSSPDLDAGKIYQWTDENGVLHLTNLPPPQDAAIQEIIQYQEKTAQEIQEYKLLQEQKRQKRLQQQQIQDAQKSEFRAQEAKKEAEEAKARAEETIQKTEEHLERYRSLKKSKKKKYRHKMRKAIKAAEEAEARANEAITKANLAEQEALEAAKKAQGIESQNR